MVYGLGIMKVGKNGKREITLKMDAVLEMDHGLFGRKMDRNLKKPSILKVVSKADKNTRYQHYILEI